MWIYHGGVEIFLRKRKEKNISTPWWSRNIFFFSLSLKLNFILHHNKN